MTDTADLNLVIARIRPGDGLHDRATKHLRTRRLLVPFSVGIEFLFIADRFGYTRAQAVGAAGAHFDIEGEDVLLLAAEALDAGEVPTVFDAVHLADAFHRRGGLHTADRRLHKTAFPTVAF